MNGTELIALLDAEFGRRNLAEWARRFDLWDVWWAPVQTLAEVVADPQAAAISAFIDQPGMAGRPPIRTVATPGRFWDEADPKPGPAPALGEHTSEVLRELGPRHGAEAEDHG